MSGPNKSTIVRFKSIAVRCYFRYVGRVAPGPAARTARDLWFAAPPRMAELTTPDSGEPFEVSSQGHRVRGLVWGAGAARTVYLVHGWGGRGAQLAAMVTPLVETGHRVVMFDMPAHGDSDPGPAGPRRTHGVEFARALEAVTSRFGPAEAVIAHSMGTISTYLAMRHGGLDAKRLVFVAPMVEAGPLIDQFQHTLGFGSRVRKAFDEAVGEFVGVALTDFDARVQAGHVEPVPTLVLTDRDDRQASYAGVVDFAATIGAQLVTTQGLGHRKILRDPAVVKRVTTFVGGAGEMDRSA